MGSENTNRITHGPSREEREQIDRTTGGWDGDHESHEYSHKRLTVNIYGKRRNYHAEYLAECNS